jgi:hypothetical protein
MNQSFSSTVKSCKMAKKKVCEVRVITLRSHTLTFVPPVSVYIIQPHNAHPWLIFLVLNPFPAYENSNDPKHSHTIYNSKDKEGANCWTRIFLATCCVCLLYSWNPSLISSHQHTILTLYIKHYFMVLQPDSLLVWIIYLEQYQARCAREMTHRP